MCSRHQLELGPQDEDTTFSYGGLHIKNDVLRLVFAEGSFASNVGDVSQGFEEALKAAGASSGSGDAFNIIARQSVRKDYDPEIGAIQTAINRRTHRSIRHQAESELQSKCYHAGQGRRQVPP